tara:strand:+ start:89 stop:358 length:270 start_codon:yes stop_codon:yes gene_type:complete
MADWSDETLRSLILELLGPKLADAQIESRLVSADDDLYEKGVLDSYDVAELLSDIAERTGIDADIDSADGGGSFILSVNSISKLFQRDF